MIIALLHLVYLVSVALLMAYAIGAASLLIVYLRRRTRPISQKGCADIINLPDGALPSVCIQLPVYNEPYVIERLIDAAARLDYPAEKLTIQVLDDSDDDTSARAAKRVAHWLEKGIHIAHIQRSERRGFKAGALAYGLSQTEAELIAVFDADFIPPQDFLCRAAGYLREHPEVGMLQTRWGHLNAEENALTRAVALALDGHFVVEQTARSQAGWLMNFNGSGGVWRAKTITEAGGWSHDTLTEDLDLSYRAQLAGWRLAYLSDLVVPGEIPPDLRMYRQQQARWAQGGTQVFARQILTVWRHPHLTLTQRLMATMHLAQYLIHALIILLIVLTPILIWSRALPDINVGPLGIISLFPPLIYAASQQALYPDWGKRLLRGFPVLLMVATGMAWCNARSALAGLVLRGGEFRRTPKLGGRKRSIEPIRAPAFGWEMALCLYCAFGAWVAFQREPAMIPYFLIYFFAFGIMTIWLLRDTLDSRRRALRV